MYAKKFLNSPNKIEVYSLGDHGMGSYRFRDFLPPWFPVLNRGGKKSLFDIKRRIFTPPPEIPNYIKIILGGKVGSYG